MTKELILAAVVSILLHLGLYQIGLFEGNKTLKEITSPAPLKVVLIDHNPPPTPSPMANRPVRPLARMDVISAAPPTSLPIPMKKIFSGGSRIGLSIKDRVKEKAQRPLYQKRVEMVTPEVHPAREFFPKQTVAEKIPFRSDHVVRVDEDTPFRAAPVKERPLGVFESRKETEKKGFTPMTSSEEDLEALEKIVARHRPIFKALPRYKYNPEPPYPLSARRRGFEGSTLLRVEVLANGRVGQIVLERSTGYPILDRSAIKTVKKWIFEPGRERDRPVAMWVKVPIRFKLH